MDTKTCGTYITLVLLLLWYTPTALFGMLNYILNRMLFFLFFFCFDEFVFLIFKALAPVLEYVQPSPEVCAFFSKVKMRQLHVDTVCVYFCVTFMQDDKTSS